MLYKNLLTLKMRTKSKETEFIYLNLRTSMYVGNRHTESNSITSCLVRNHVKLMRVINSRRGFSKGTVLCGGY